MQVKPSKSVEKIGGHSTYGMRTAFIDRRKRPFGETPHQPDFMVANFAELAATLA